MKTKTFPHRLAALAIASSLAACSGGGGAAGLSTEPAAITSMNATDVAHGAAVTLSLIELEEIMGFETLTADGAGTVDCPEGGSISAAFDADAPPVGVVSTGDRFSIDFDDCFFDPSFSIDGGIAIDFQTITGDFVMDDTWEVDIDFEIDRLTFSTGPTSGSFDADWSQSVSYMDGDAEFAMAGDFTTRVNDGGGLTAAAITDFMLTCAYDAMAAESTYSIDGDFASTELGGTITLTTLTPIVMADGAANPHEGVLRATGSGGSQLTLTILDATFVQLDVDADGDDTYESMDVTTWAELTD